MSHDLRVGLWLIITTPLLLGLVACKPGNPSTNEPGAASVVFTGMCDASGAVPLTAELFAVADDEDNVLRIYNADKGGAPLAQYELSNSLGLHPQPRKNSAKPPKAPPELDIEGATLYKNLAYWITSHGRNSSGKYKAERLHFFATSVGDQHTPMEVVGNKYENLVADLNADTRFQQFDLLAAAAIAPKEPGGLNIEGLTERKEGGMWIGFRNPIPNNNALVFALLNPDAVIHGQPAAFSDPILLDLAGRGIRAMTWWRGQYLIAAGAYASDQPSALYTWDGTGAPQQLHIPDLSISNPEAFFTPESRDKVLVLNDEGAKEIAGTECKKLKNSGEKQFSGVWISLGRGDNSSKP